MYEKLGARPFAAGVLVLLLGACGASTSSSSGGAGPMAGMSHGDTTMIGGANSPASMTPASMAPASMPMGGTTADAMAGMDHSGGAMEPMTDAIGDGTSPSAGGYTLKVVAAPTKVGTSSLTFTVAGTDGKAITDAVVEQTKKLHLIVVRRDLSGYQHLHPTVDPSGVWSVQADFPTAGRWHVIADLTPVAGKRIVLGADVTITGTEVVTPLPAPSATATVDGYTVSLLGKLTTKAANLDIGIDKGGAGATDITTYLGAGGHLVALNTSTLAYTHLHPLNDPGSMLRFDAAVPTAGRYRLYLQFASGEVVHTAEFTVDVTG